MNVEIKDAAALSSISIMSLRAYLVSRGWTDLGRWGERAITVFGREDDGKSWEVLVPHRDTMGGYAENMAQSVAVLSSVEQRSQLDVFYDLRGSAADVIRVHSANGHTREPLSMSQSAALLSDTYKMVAASARAVERPQAAYRGKTSASVQGFLDRLQPVSRLDSYALTVHSPVPVEMGNQSDMGDDYTIPFSRKATYKLAEALRNTEQALEMSIARNSLDAFVEVIPNGVSANLCSSVSELAMNGQGIQIDLEWADVRPSTIPDSHFQFSMDSAEILQQASRAFSRNRPSHDEEVVGQIVELAREPKEFDGRATIVSVWDNRTIRLSVTFAQVVYETVIGAFRDQAIISLLGDIYPEGRGYELRNPRNVLVISED